MLTLLWINLSISITFAPQYTYMRFIKNSLQTYTGWRTLIGINEFAQTQISQLNNQEKMKKFYSFLHQLAIQSSIFISILVRFPVKYRFEQGNPGAHVELSSYIFPEIVFSCEVVHRGSYVSLDLYYSTKMYFVHRGIHITHPQCSGFHFYWGSMAREEIGIVKELPGKGCIEV
jgi:hypothetical protein